MWMIAHQPNNYKSRRPCIEDSRVKKIANSFPDALAEAKIPDVVTEGELKLPQGEMPTVTRTQNERLRFGNKLRRPIRSSDRTYLFLAWSDVCRTLIEPPSRYPVGNVGMEYQP